MRVMIISPHPDDETLGAGGTILRYVEEGHEVFWLNITNMSDEYGHEIEEIDEKQMQIHKVSEMLGVEELIDLGLQPAAMEQYSKKELIGKMAKVIGRVCPEMLILPFYGDIHSDHRIITETALAFTKSFRFPSIKRVLLMEVISETDISLGQETFTPNYYVDISKYIEQKVEIAAQYNGEILEHPFPRSIEHIKALGIHRGAQSGCSYAEAFMLIKFVE